MFKIILFRASDRIIGQGSPPLHYVHLYPLSPWPKWDWNKIGDREKWTGDHKVMLGE